ncbi:hypothetical protein MBANPS3_009598 [Mucor bainieri]
MQAILSLPEELSLAILSKLSIKQLAECRLVCKHWSLLAARTMLGKRITIDSEAQALKLYSYLSRDPSKAAIIRYMRFKLDSPDLPFVVYCLLQLTFNANTIKMTGRVKSDKFFTALFDIADRAPPSTFSQLQQLPTYTGQNSKTTDRKYLTFKSAVRSFSLGIAGDALPSVGRINWVDLFDQFPNLTTLTLSGAPSGFNDIESKLKNCHHLKHLYLRDLFYGGLTMNDMTRGQVMTWASSKVHKEKSLRSLSIEVLIRPELIEYLLFKYPHVRSIILRGRLWFRDRSLRLEHDGMNRILDSLKTIRHKQITFVLPTHIEMREVIEYMATRDENVDFFIEEFDGQDELAQKYSIM